MPSRCTLTTIARAAKVSVSTVSYALRRDPKIPHETVERILRTANRLGYRPNPGVSTLMAHIRAGRLPRAQERLAFVWVEGGDDRRNLPYHRECLRGARERAEELGYRLEEFSLSDAGMTPMRLSGILKARGIAGIVFSSVERRPGVDLQMDWPAHAMAIIGNARWSPELHRAGHYHYMGMRRIMLELAMRGYERPIALFDESINQRANRSWEAAFLAFHPKPGNARRLLCPVQRLDSAETAQQLEKQRPDAAIVTYAEDAAPVRATCARLGLEVGIVATQVHDEGDDVAGIAPNHAQIAANAVDLVLGQLYRNERGVPESPKELLFDGHWVEGRTLRARRVERLPDIVL